MAKGGLSCLLRLRARSALENGGHEQPNRLIFYVNLRPNGKSQVSNSCFVRGWSMRLPLPNWHASADSLKGLPTGVQGKLIVSAYIGPAPMILAQGAEGTQDTVQVQVSRGGGVEWGSNILAVYWWEPTVTNIKGLWLFLGHCTNNWSPWKSLPWYGHDTQTQSKADSSRCGNEINPHNNLDCWFTCRIWCLRNDSEL